MIKEITAFMTTDGQMHPMKEDAIKHQKLIELTTKAENFAKLHYPDDFIPVVGIIVKWEEEKPLPVLTLESLPLVHRTFRVLYNDNITTIEMLKKYSFEGLLKIPNMGRRSANELRNVLASIGIYLKEKDEN